MFQYFKFRFLIFWIFFIESDELHSKTCSLNIHFLRNWWFYKFLGNLEQGEGCCPSKTSSSKWGKCWIYYCEGK